MPRLLIVKTSSLGDVIHNLPIVADIHSRYPDMRIDWLVEESFADIPRLHAGVANVHTVAARRWRKALLDRATWLEIRECKAKLRSASYDMVLDTQGLLKSAVFSRFAHAPCHGQDRQSAREPLAACFYRHKYHIPQGQHAITRNRQLAAAALRYPMPDTPPDYGIAAGLANSEQQPFNSANPYVMGLHGTSRDAKLWPTDHWIALGIYLTKKQTSLILPWGSKQEYERAQIIAASVPLALVLPRLRIKEMISVFAGANAAVGVDTGLAHLAVALRLPTIGIYTDTYPELTGLYPQAGSFALNLGGHSQLPSVEQVTENLQPFI